jgi:hypothetical protein
VVVVYDWLGLSAFTKTSGVRAEAKMITPTTKIIATFLFIEKAPEASSIKVMPAASVLLFHLAH